MKEAQARKGSVQTAQFLKRLTVIPPFLISAANRCNKYSSDIREKAGEKASIDCKREKSASMVH